MKYHLTPACLTLALGIWKLTRAEKGEEENGLSLSVLH